MKPISIAAISIVVGTIISLAAGMSMRKPLKEGKPAKAALFFAATTLGSILLVILIGKYFLSN